MGLFAALESVQKFFLTLCSQVFTFVLQFVIASRTLHSVERRMHSVERVREESEFNLAKISVVVLAYIAIVITVFTVAFVR